MPKIWKKNKIDKWIHKIYKYVYKSDYLISFSNIYATQTKYANARKR